MVRPRKTRHCACPHRAAGTEIYKPAGTPLIHMEKIVLFHDELEALHLCDGEGMTQEQAGTCMGVSRGTVQRLVSEARHKVATALVQQAALVITTQATKAEPDKGEHQ